MSDLISRQAAIEHLKKRLYETELNSYAPFPYYAEMADNRVSVWLNELPTTDPVKHGKWMFEPGIMYCSVCGWMFSYENGLEEEYEYCPHCGATMERSEDG